MIFVTGDCHADYKKLSASNFKEQKFLTRDDFVIVCGDFGIWHDTNEERYWLDWLNDKPFTTLFVDGNHENFDRLNGGNIYGGEFEAVNFHGGMAHRIREHIYHLMRGYVFDLCGKSVFAFGGARSHDIQDGVLDEKDFPSHRAFMQTYNRMHMERKMFRVNHMSWWAEEMPSQEEMELARINLKAHNNAVDIIITHDCPKSIGLKIYGDDFEGDQLNDFFDEVAQANKFDTWAFGHHHYDVKIDDKYFMLYRSIRRIA